MMIEEILNLMTVVSAITGVLALAYVGILSGVLPLPGNIDWRSYLGRLLFSVASGVFTWFVTYTLFGHGVEDASVSGIATAAAIGGITKIIGGNTA